VCSREGGFREAIRARGGRYVISGVVNRSFARSSPYISARERERMDTTEFRTMDYLYGRHKWGLEDQFVLEWVSDESGYPQHL